MKLSEFLRVVVSELRSIANGFASDAMKPEYNDAAPESYIGRTKRIFIEARALEIQAESLEASPAALTREEGGRIVREAWLNWLANSPSISGQRPASWSAEWNDLKEEDKEVDRQIFEAVAGALSKAQPTAERTATTKDIRDELESTYRLLMDDADFIDEQHPALAISIKGGCDSIKKCIDALDAQERAGVKAEICNAWHGNDFSQCQLPKGHEGNHLCIMTWEWPTASNAASEQGGAT
nr:hypothetical protein [Ferrimicrobium acidiphilum]